MAAETTAVEVMPQKFLAEYIPFGAKDMIRLNCEVVRNLICTPTRSGKLPDDKACMKFIAMAKASHLNPFAGDCYLIGYDSQEGPTFSIVTAHQAFLKRAETHAEYNGMKSGVIVQAKFDAEDGEYRRVIRKQSGNIVYEREGDLTFSDETLIGGWAEVYFKSREFPTLRRVNLKTFDKGSGQWRNADNKAYMIVKVAEADALRSSFPTLLGGLYAEGETSSLLDSQAPQKSVGLDALNSAIMPSDKQDREDVQRAIMTPGGIVREGEDGTLQAVRPAPKKRAPKNVEVQQEPVSEEPPAIAPEPEIEHPDPETIPIPSITEIRDMAKLWPTEDRERMGAFYKRCQQEGMSLDEARRDTWIHVGRKCQQDFEEAMAAANG